MNLLHPAIQPSRPGANAETKMANLRQGDTDNPCLWGCKVAWGGDEDCYYQLHATTSCTPGLPNQPPLTAALCKTSIYASSHESSHGKHL